MQPEEHEDGKPADERNEIGPVRLSIRRMAQGIQKLQEEERGGEQQECRYIVAKSPILSIAVVLDQCQPV